MLEEINDIQSRIADIQQRIDALSAPAAPAPVPAETPAFGQALAQAQDNAPGLVPAVRPAQGNQTVSVNGKPVFVPPAALGPLPPMPVAPGSVAPLPTNAAAEQIGSLIQTYAAKHNLPADLVKAVIQTESGGNPRAVSPAGAMGLMQLMPANVQEAGISDPFDPEQNIAAGTRQLAGLMSQYHGDLDLALAGYNAGPGNVRKYGGVPPFAETQNYIRKIRAAMQHG